MKATRLGRSLGAKLARALLERIGGGRDSALEGRYPPDSRHRVYRLADDRIIDVFLKSARLYDSREEFLADLASRP